MKEFDEMDIITKDAIRTRSLETKLIKDYKNSVNNIIGCIQKYSKGLVDDIENNFITEIDYKLLDE